MDSKAQRLNHFPAIKYFFDFKRIDVSIVSSTTSRSKFRGGGKKAKLRVPIGRMALLTILYLTMCVIYPGTGRVTENSTCPFDIESLKNCECKPISTTDSYFISLECQNINSTQIFLPISSSNIKSGDLETNDMNSIESQRFLSNQDTLSDDWVNLKKKVRHIIIKDSTLECVTFTDFLSFINLEKLVITGSELTKLNGCDIQSNRYKSGEKVLKSVTTLNLSKNKIRTIHMADFQNFPRLKEIDLSKNSIRDLEDVFTNLQNLEELDLSFNQLDANLDQNVLYGISKSIKSFDISSKYLII